LKIHTELSQSLMYSSSLDSPAIEIIKGTYLTYHNSLNDFIFMRP